MRAPCVRCDFLLERLPSDSLSDSGFRRRRAFPYLGQTSSNSCLPWSRPPRRLLPPRAQNSELAAHTTRTTRNITTTHTLRLKPKRNHTHCALRLLSLSGHPSLLTYLLRSFNFGPTVACRSIKATDRIPRAASTHTSLHTALTNLQQSVINLN